MKSVTLKDVAAESGVSVSTVSRILDERLPPSRSATARRVREVAAQLGYRKDLAASALRRGGTGTIGVLVPRLTDTVMAMMFEALYESAFSRGQFAFVSVSHDEPSIERKAAENLVARRVDGIVLAAARLNDPLPAMLSEQGVPHVLALRSNGDSPASVCDDELGGYLATRHLIDLGHTKIGALTGPEYTSTGNGRHEGYMSAMAEAGLAVEPGWVHRTGFGSGSGESAGQRLLFEHPEVTAVFCANDDLALGVMSAAQTAGRSVPENLSVVGYNDTPIARKLPVPLTSVRVPFDQIATAALDLLDAIRTTTATRSDGASEDESASGVLATPLRTATPTLIPRASSVRL